MLSERNQMPQVTLRDFIGMKYPKQVNPYGQDAVWGLPEVEVGEIGKNCCLRTGFPSEVTKILQKWTEVVIAHTAKVLNITGLFPLKWLIYIM